MTAGVIVLLVVVAAVAAYGGWWAASNGRFRGTHQVRGGTGGRAASASNRSSEAAATRPPSWGRRRDHEPVETTWETVLAAGSIRDASLGERATLVQFSTSFCMPCRAAHRILTDVADLVPGVVHVEVNAEHHLELVRRLGVMRTPTTLVLGPDGHEVTRASGAPTKGQVLNALAQVS